MRRMRLYLTLLVIAAVVGLTLGAPSPVSANDQTLILAQRGAREIQRVEPPAATRAPAPPAAAPPPPSAIPEPIPRPAVTKGAIPEPIPRPHDTKSATPIPIPKPRDTKGATPMPLPEPE